MLKVCIEKVNAGNKPHNHFTKLGWANIAEKFNKATNLRYEFKQFRNWWNSLKKNGNYGLSLLGRTQVLIEMRRRKPLLLVMNGGKPKLRYALFKENRVFVETNLFFFFFSTCSLSYYNLSSFLLAKHCYYSNLIHFMMLRRLFGSRIV